MTRYTHRYPSHKTWLHTAVQSCSYSSVTKPGYSAEKWHLSSQAGLASHHTPLPLPQSACLTPHLPCPYESSPFFPPTILTTAKFITKNLIPSSSYIFHQLNIIIIYTLFNSLLLSTYNNLPKNSELQIM